MLSLIRLLLLCFAHFLGLFVFVYLIWPAAQDVVYGDILQLPENTQSLPYIGLVGTYLVTGMIGITMTNLFLNKMVTSIEIFSGRHSPLIKIWGMSGPHWITGSAIFIASIWIFLALFLPAKILNIAYTVECFIYSNCN